MLFGFFHGVRYKTRSSNGSVICTVSLFCLLVVGGVCFLAACSSGTSDGGMLVVLVEVVVEGLVGERRLSWRTSILPPARKASALQKIEQSQKTDRISLFIIDMLVRRWWWWYGCCWPKQERQEVCVLT